MVAHISSDEAKLLKSLGGSGTINPHTGLPEFWGISSITKPIQRAVGQLNPFNPGSTVGGALQQVPGVKETQNLATQVFQPLEKSIVQPASAGLASFDKAVGNTVPGGWGTVASIAGSAMGLPTPFLIGLGAANGSGVMRKGGKFNLQGAIMGGAMAYGMSELGEYMRAAAPPTVDPTTGLMTTPVPDVSPEFGSIEEALPKDYAPIPEPSGYTAGANGTMQPTFDASAPLTEPIVPPSAPSVDAYQPPSFDPSYDPNAGIRQPIMDSLSRGEFGDAAKTLTSDVGKAFSNAGTSISEGVKSAYDTVTNPDSYSNLGTKASNYADARMGDLSQTGSGIKSILTGSANPAAAAAVKAGTIMSPALATGMTIYGGMGVADVAAQQQYLKDQLASNNISQAEYNNAMAEVERSADIARKAVSDSPFSTNPDRSASIGDTYYARSSAGNTIYGRGDENTRLYAMGGQVNQPDDQTGIPNASPMKNFDGGMMSYASGGMPPRFLSGGGDGMSDSIPANIGGKQEARLADGEFVIPADVVSHLGNGSSKAGAKQLYSMMDKVRQARTGRKSQGKQINPRKYLPA
jgi:hypothetical protein